MFPSSRIWVRTGGPLSARMDPRFEGGVVVDVVVDDVDEVDEDVDEEVELVVTMGSAKVTVTPGAPEWVLVVGSRTRRQGSTP